MADVNGTHKKTYPKASDFDFQKLEIPPMVCGIYFLLRGEEVVYVGKATDIVGRVQKHRHPPMFSEVRKKFDGVRYVVCEPHELDALERFWIKFFDPIDNRVFTRRHSSKLHPQAISKLQIGRLDFDEPTIMDLDLLQSEKVELIEKGIETVSQLRESAFSVRFAEALHRFDFYHSDGV